MTSEENKKESYHDFEKQRQSTNSVHLLLVSNSQILLDFLPTSQLPHDFISNFSFMRFVQGRTTEPDCRTYISRWRILESSQVRVDEITQSNSRWTSVSRCSMEKLKMKKKRVHRIRVSNRRDRQIGESKSESEKVKLEREYRLVFENSKIRN
ncbi:hypothetical protein YC2023_103951 [Brassica napus]